MQKHERYIVADIGGTNARFAYLTSDNAQLRDIRCYQCADFPQVGDAINQYISDVRLSSVQRLCLAAAGPLEHDQIDLPNNHWCCNRLQLQQDLGMSVTLLNDFTAQTLCIDALDETDLLWIGQPRPESGQVKAILGPGTGLGVSAMMPNGEIVPSEGGHISFAPTNEHELALLRALWERYPRVSVERILSGMGLANLYWANAKLQGINRELTPEQVTDGAHESDSLCVKTIDDFVAILAAVAGDVALMMGASGGLYLSGGILPRIKQALDSGRFRERFEDKGRFRLFCSRVPVALILNEHPGLVGCAQALKLDDS